MIVFHLLRVVPKNLVSYLTGWIMRCRFPRPFCPLMAKTFVNLFKIEMSESLIPLESFATLEDVFTRRLKPGQRACQSTFCSPADGILVRSSSVEEGRDWAVQCKGNKYSLDLLVFGDNGLKCTTKFGCYCTIYLAPHNYHRVHSPCHGKLRAIRYIPGKLWPVNHWASTRVPGLFVQNERMIFEIEIGGGGYVYVVMVGALNVGRIQTDFWEGFVSNSLKSQFLPRYKSVAKTLDITIQAGDELGVFMLGSTVIVAMDEAAAKRYPILQCESKSSIIVGKSLLRDN